MPELFKTIMKYKIGDQVRINDRIGYKKYENVIGKIINIRIDSR